MLSDVPNLAVCTGYSNASWTRATFRRCSCADFFNYMGRHHHSQCTPHHEGSNR